MIRSLYSGVSGLKTHQQKMDVIGNNISNVNTVGFKYSTVSFKDIYYQTLKNPSASSNTSGGINGSQVGYGTTLGSVTNVMSRSGFQYSNSVYDVALAGEGFFQVMDVSGNILYTRAGSFYPDDSGNLVDVNGNRVLGVMGKYTGSEPSSNPIQLIVPSVESNVASAKKVINGSDVIVSASIPSSMGNITVKFTNSAFPFATFSGGVLEINFDMDYQYSSEADFQNAIDAAILAGGVELPGGIEVNISFANVPTTNLTAVAATNTFDINGTDKLTFTSPVPGALGNNNQVVFQYVSGNDRTSAVWEGSVLTLTICENTTQANLQDAITASAGDNESRKIIVTGSLPTDSAELQAAFGKNPRIRLSGGKDSFYTEVSNLLSAFKLEGGRVASQQSIADLESVIVGNDGTITGYHPVLGYLELGRIDIATFDNPAGLAAAGNSYFRATPASGEAKVTRAGENSSGELVSGALEMSNVDLSQEFSDMIVTQRGFQANSRVITTSDTMLEELINLKR